MAENYLDSLPNEDIDQLALALDEGTTLAIRLDKLSNVQKWAVENTDEIIKDAPAPGKPITIYKAFKDVDFSQGGKLEEPAFFTGSTDKPPESENVAILKVKIPAGMPALELPGGLFVLVRGLKFDLEATETGPISAILATVEETLSLDSVETGHIHIDSEGNEEFFNKCHGEGGRFCSGPGGGGGGVKETRTAIKTAVKDPSNKGSWPKFGDQHEFKKIAEAPEGKTLGLFEKRVVVDGFKVKSAWEVTTKDGSKIKVYDLDGKEFGDVHKNVSNAIADMHSLYPMRPPRSLVMMDRNVFSGAFAFVYPNRPQIFVNQKELKNLEGDKYGNLDRGHFMPSFDQKNKSATQQYLTVHEYGHQYDFNSPSQRGKQNGITSRSRTVGKNLWANKENRKHLSKYGKYISEEGYAEAFAEWHVSKGRTKNIAAREYARHEGWHGSGTKAVTASGEIEAFYLEPWIFAYEEVEVEGDDLKDLLPFDPEEGPIIIERFDKRPEVVKPGKKAKVEASADGFTVTVDIESPSMETGTINPGTGHIHINSDGTEEFYNKCHDAQGRFCPGGGGGFGGGPLTTKAPAGDGDGTGDSDTKDLGGSTIDGIKGYDPRGKPIPGTDAWIEAHGMSREVFEKRPYTRFQKDPNDPAIAKEYGNYPKDHRLFKKVAGQTPGYIMERNPVPGSPYGKILGEVRPDTRVVLDPGDYARRQTILANDKKRLADLKKFNHGDLVKDRQTRLKAAEDNLKKTREATPDSIRKEAGDRVDKADSALKKAKASAAKDPNNSDKAGRVKEAQVEFDRAKRSSVRADRIAKNWRPDKEIYDAETALSTAKKRLERAQTDPTGALRHDIQAAERRVIRSQNRLDKAAIKYTFPSQPGAASRLDVHQDPRNLKNLTEGKGRVYWSMEGNIKADAVLTALKKEDPTAAVISNPSVTLWQNSETQWVARKHLQGREVVLLPDADGVKNPNVVAQAKGLQAALQNAGAGRVIIASPPLKNGRIDKITLPSGAKDERKGVDDHLGAGKGTLGQMTYTEQTLPRISLREHTKEGGALGPKLNRNALKNTEQTMTAISSIVGERGVGKVPKNMIAQASGLPPTSALDARRRLEKIGAIKVEYVFDPDALSRGKKVQIMSDERINELVRKKVIKQPRLDDPFSTIDFDESPVITVLNKKYLAKEKAPKSLSSIDTWNPPNSFKGWTSPVTGKPATVAAVKKAPAGRRLVRSKAGAARYGVAVGQPIPIVKASSGVLNMVSVDLVHTDQEPGNPVDTTPTSPEEILNMVSVDLNPVDVVPTSPEEILNMVSVDLVHTDQNSEPKIQLIEREDA